MPPTAQLPCPLAVGEGVGKVEEVLMLKLLQSKNPQLFFITVAIH
jgi:hypothetical protein